jgi:hypothetical protein
VTGNDTTIHGSARPVRGRITMLSEGHDAGAVRILFVASRTAAAAP